MVWVKLVFFCLTFLSSIRASELSQDEINYFNIMDLNNDGYVSTDEINQSINIIFQLIDINNDKKIRSHKGYLKKLIIKYFVIIIILEIK